MFNILVAEDDAHTRRMLQAMLRYNGYCVFPAADGLEALEILDRQQIDLLVLDVMMPKMDGYQLTRELRENQINLPILMLSAKSQPEDRRQGFIVGTDDYMVKPFDEQEMLLRIKALLRRAQIANEQRIVIGDVVLDYNQLTVSRGEEKQTLPQKEFYLLYKLLAYPEQVFTRLQLMDEIWGMDCEAADSTVTSHINRLRTRFRDYPEFEIVSVRGIGYKAVKKI